MPKPTRSAICKRPRNRDWCRKRITGAAPAGACHVAAYVFPDIAVRHPRLPVGDGARRHHAGAGVRRQETGAVIIGATNIATGHHATDHAPIGIDSKKQDRAAEAALSFGICVITLRHICFAQREFTARPC
ncbi:hypothetical protein D8666_16435 [Ochrobactrum soli]|nr:hypothetical protein D8666_16435 [[Ochrobactrum] soli]